MKKRILVLATGNIYERRGFFNAVVSRTKHLSKIADYDIDALLLSTYEPWLVRKLRNTRKHAKPNELKVDGVKMKIDWRRFSLVDYILSVQLHKGTIFKKIHNARIVNRLYGYDFIIAHSTECGLIAKAAKEKFGIPYSVTWHGSDIHSSPFCNKSSFKDTKSVIEDATVNFFVSDSLLKISNSITQAGNKIVLYNGFNSSFFKYTDDKRDILKRKFGVYGKKVVVFAGNFLAIKNILTIPSIFKIISDKVENLECWMIGGGKYFNQVREMVKGLPVRLWGNQEPEQMPDFLNAADVLILPSINEGLPLTVVEGLACGCNVVGSLVGGIPEVIGSDNCVDLADPEFEQKFADKVVSYLQAEPHIEQALGMEFDWKRSAEKENNIIESIIIRKK